MAGGTKLYVARTSSLENYTNYISIILIIFEVTKKAWLTGYLID
jgi:hypothetical protein